MEKRKRKKTGVIIRRNKAKRKKIPKKSNILQ